MKNKKCFLAGPFTNLINKETSIMGCDDIVLIENLIDFLSKRNYDVHNAHKREKWGLAFMTPDECTEIDYREIKNCDLFIAFPGIPASPGTHIEIGWASALKKTIILLLHNSSQDYAHLIKGLHTVADVKEIIFNTEKDYLDDLDKYLKELECKI